MLNSVVIQIRGEVTEHLKMRTYKLILRFEISSTYFPLSNFFDIWNFKSIEFVIHKEEILLLMMDRHISNGLCTLLQ